jgi:hypothetical protein
MTPTSSSRATGHTKVLAQEADKQLPGLNLSPAQFAVNSDGDEMTRHFWTHLRGQQERHGNREDQRIQASHGSPEPARHYHRQLHLPNLPVDKDSLGNCAGTRS